MRYLLDLDHTLLDTERLKERAFRDGTDCLVGTPQFWDRYCATEFLYEDVMEWLRAREREALHILTAFKPSQGPEAEAFQRSKVESCGFGAHMGSVTVIEGLKGEAAAEIAKRFPPHEPVVFIDDLLEQCLSVKEALPAAHCFLMVRDGESPVVPPTLHVVSCLKEVDAIMETI